jgi:hypothetical protein
MIYKDTIELDEDGYPEEFGLILIEHWDSSDFLGLIDFITPAFEQYGGLHFFAKRTQVTVSTGGWSGCEDVLHSMRTNTVWWMMYWHSSYRGGKFVFESRGNE